MIRVNLLAARQRSMSSANSASAAISLSDNQRAQELIKRLGILAILPLALFFVEREIIPTKLEERNVAKKRLDELQLFNSRRNEMTTKIETRQKDANRFEAQLNALKNLKHSQFYELRVIDLIQDIIPERVWVSEMRFTKAPAGTSEDNRLELGLSTTSDTETENFFTAMNNQQDYVIEALYTDRRQRVDNPKIKDFGLTVVLKNELPSLKNQWDAGAGIENGSLPPGPPEGSPPGTQPPGEVKR